MVQPGHPGDALGNFALGGAGSAQTAKVTLDVGGEHRHSGIAEGFGQALQRDGFAGAGGTRNQTVAVRQAHCLGNRLTGEVGTDNELQ